MNCYCFLFSFLFSIHFSFFTILSFLCFSVFLNGISAFHQFFTWGISSHRRSKGKWDSESGLKVMFIRALVENLRGTLVFSSIEHRVTGTVHKHETRKRIKASWPKG